MNEHLISIQIAKYRKAAGLTQEELLKALEERQILRSMELELEGGEVTAYELAEPAAFVPFLYLARCFMQTGMNYICVGNYDKPLLQKDNCNAQYNAQNVVQTGSNYIYFGNYDNSCLSETISPCLPTISAKSRIWHGILFMTASARPSQSY